MVFVVGGARSGTTLLFEMLSRSPRLWSPYRELHGPYEWDIGLHPDVARGQSNALDAAAATPARVAALHAAVRDAARNRELFGFPSGRFRRASRWVGRGAGLVASRLPLERTFVDKNPKHCFRVPFLRAAFPGARVVFLLRHPHGNVHSLMEGWASQRFVTYDVRGTGCKYPRWSFDLPPGWRDWADRELPELCARQWVGYNESLLAAEAALPPEARLRVHYEALLAQPLTEMRRIFDWLGLPLSGEALRMAHRPPVVNTTTAPNRDKWRTHEATILAHAELYAPLLERLGYDEHGLAAGAAKGG